MEARAQSSSLARVFERPVDRPTKPNHRERWSISIQLLMMVVASALALAPPVEGKILIAPLVPGESADSVRWAITAGALVIEPGPYRGSYIVMGSRAALLLPALSHGTLLIDARLAGCGAINPEER